MLMHYVRQYRGFFHLQLGVDYVVINSPEAAEVIFSSNQHIQKGEEYESLEPWLGTGLLTSTGTKWHKRRKMLTPAFHFTILDQFMDVFNEQSQVLVAKLKDTGGQRVNVFPFITKATLDIICEATMGVQIKAQDGARTDYVQAVYDMGEVVFFRFMRPWLRNDLVFRLSSLYKVQKDSLKLLHGFTDSVIRTRREELSKATSCDGGAVTDEAGKKKRRAFLDLLLHSTIDGRPLSDADIREEVDTFMFEGHDTTSAGTNWALYNLGRNPDVQQKVYDELVEVLGDQQRPLTRDDLPKLRYLEMVIKETLRLFPPVPMIGRRLNSDTVIDGYPIPGSCNVGLLVYAIHRDPVHWPDPERFDPERFSPENSKGRHPYSYVPFSAGPRNCIGQKFALMEEKVLLASVVRTFHVTSHDSLDTIKLRPDVILRLEGGLFLSFTPRDQ
ncbi:cytochrome P450 4V2-like isoform X3 [Amphibalanus amphitrite]|uniref:cytochrome P450 4V2-like isoform X3 n=1 Tax=Amphibalanus amphitrite TaxID=1232801 RepID=UPI001C9250DB|nr:cytochrome P450 4V2-like isoform X3 [Amphibalanus amphitrite]